MPFPVASESRVIFVLGVRSSVHQPRPSRGHLAESDARWCVALLCTRDSRAQSCPVVCRSLCRCAVRVAQGAMARLRSTCRSFLASPLPPICSELGRSGPAAVAEMHR